MADIYIEELAKDTAAKMSDQECVILLVTKQSGANEASAAEAVEKRLESLTAGNPEIDYYIAYSAAEYINTAIMSSLQNIVLGVILAALVVFLFLRNLGTTLAIIVSMPVCILAVFVLMDVFDLTLNIMSIGGIAMGVGMIVDNSIVVLENIYSYAFRGNDRLSSCLDGTKEVD